MRRKYKLGFVWALRCFCFLFISVEKRRWARIQIRQRADELCWRVFGGWCLWWKRVWWFDGALPSLSLCFHAAAEILRFFCLSMVRMQKPLDGGTHSKAGNWFEENWAKKGGEIRDLKKDRKWYIVRDSTAELVPKRILSVVNAFCEEKKSLSR